jgi:hypothetical protein
LDGGAPSLEALVGDLLAALAAKDRDALDRLRVSEREYVDVIVPGNVEPGQPPQRMPADKVGYFWASLNTKSLYWEQHLLDEFGGRAYTLKGIDYGKGEKEYAGFRAYRQLRLTLEDEQGLQRDLGTGSAVEVKGKFKFVSFVRD